MTSTGPATSPVADVTRSKDLPWFRSTVGSSLTPAGRQLLEQYSGIEPSEMENHLYKIREIAWEIFPWPCVGEFWFIKLGLSLHPSYQLLLTRLRAHSNSVKFLDLGTCLGQDLRKLVFDGVPMEFLYGCDVIPAYERVGQELFHDADTFKGRFIAADLCADDADNALVETEGTWDIISIVSFLHLYDWASQIRACKRILKLLAQKPGSMVIGAQNGSTQPGVQLIKPPFCAEGEHKSVFRQSVETFTQMWTVVEQDEGIRLKVDVVYGDKEEDEVLGKTEYSSGPDWRRLYYTVEMV